eukprot:7016846-Alexandrium_andersonii.AAC.1
MQRRALLGTSTTRAALARAQASSPSSPARFCSRRRSGATRGARSCDSEDCMLGLLTSGVAEH